MTYNFHWDAVLRNQDDQSDSIIDRIERATMIEPTVTLAPAGSDGAKGTEVTAYVFPNSSPVQWLYLVTGRGDLRKIEHSYPFCRSGISVDITVTAIIPLDDRAMVGRIEGYSDGSSLSFFDPYFYADREKLVVDQQYTFTLAALAFEYAKSTGWDYDPKRGGYDSSGMTLLWPVSDDDEYQFRTQIWEVERFTIDGQEFYGIRGEFARGHEDLQWWTYSFNHVMNGYVPKLGEYIDGCLWLQGHISR
jgi:hypothetical protein